MGQNDEVESGHLFCQNAHVFPVMDYIRRFVDSEYYAESFGKVPFIGMGFGILWPASQHPNYEWRVLNTFDWYSPKYQWKHTIEEVTGWFIQAGLTNVQALPVSVSVTCRRPVG